MLPFLKFELNRIWLYEALRYLVISCFWASLPVSDLTRCGLKYLLGSAPSTYIALASLICASWRSLMMEGSTIARTIKTIGVAIRNVESEPSLVEGQTDSGWYHQAYDRDGHRIGVADYGWRNYLGGYSRDGQVYDDRGRARGETNGSGSIKK